MKTKSKPIKMPKGSMKGTFVFLIEIRFLLGEKFGHPRFTRLRFTPPGVEIVFQQNDVPSKMTTKYGRTWDDPLLE